MVRVSLPREFKSLYRLFLRTVSAAVLHHPQATRNLRRLWRPIFDAGAYVTKKYEKPVGKRSIVPQHPFLGQWLKQWEQRGQLFIQRYTILYQYASFYSRSGQYSGYAI